MNQMIIIYILIIGIFSFLFGYLGSRLMGNGFIYFWVIISIILLARIAFCDEKQVCFTPDEDCTSTIVTTLSQAKRSLEVQAYYFTSAMIAQGVANAKGRGVEVKVILDRSQKSMRFPAERVLLDAGIPVFIDSKHAIAHNKIMIIDQAVVITGSFNFTAAAQDKNAENLLIEKDGELASEYEKNFLKHLEHSKEILNGR